MEVREELTVSSSQSKDCDLCCSKYDDLIKKKASRAKESRGQRDWIPGSSALEADALTTRPTMRSWYDDLVKKKPHAQS